MVFYREELSTITLNCHIIKTTGDILYLWPFEFVFCYNIWTSVCTLVKCKVVYIRMLSHNSTILA